MNLLEPGCQTYGPQTFAPTLAMMRDLAMAAAKCPGCQASSHHIFDWLEQAPCVLDPSNMEGKKGSLWAWSNRQGSPCTIHQGMMD